MAEMENLRAEKVSLEESSKLAGKKFEDELAELKAQIGTLQSQVYPSQKLFLMMLSKASKSFYQRQGWN